MPDSTQTYYSAAGPIELSYERRQRSNQLSGDLFNDSGYVIRAVAETGEDLHFWSFIYEQKGGEIIIDGDVSQSLIVYGKYTEAEKQYMHPDAAFVNKGQNIDDYYPPDTIVIDEESKDEASWELGGRVHFMQPPKFAIRGTHAGVEADVSIDQTSKAFFHKGRFEDIAQNGGSAGYVVHCRASGTIKVHGKTLKFTNGHAIKERIIQSGFIPDRLAYMSGRGLNWMHGFGDTITWYIIGGEGKRHGGFINVDGDQMALESASAGRVEELAHWVDPKTKCLQAYRWKVTMSVSKGVLEAEVYAYGRAIYTWVRRGGVLLVNQFVANAKVKFTHQDGRVFEEPQMASVEQMRTLYQQPLDQ